MNYTYLLNLKVQNNRYQRHLGYDIITGIILICTDMEHNRKIVAFLKLEYKKCIANVTK